MHARFARRFLARTCLAGLALASALAPAARGDVAKADDIAYRMATDYTKRGYAMTPSGKNGIIGGGSVMEFLFPVSKGVDYIFLLGADENLRQSQIYVYDEVGNLIRDDQRRGNLGRAGVGFRSAYNGTVKVYFVAVRTRGLGAWSVLVGRRGAERRSSDDAAPNNPPAVGSTPSGYEARTPEPSDN